MDNSRGCGKRPPTGGICYALLLEPVDDEAGFFEPEPEVPDPDDPLEPVSLDDEAEPADSDVPLPELPDDSGLLARESVR
ncbi:MAG TPA: hypothetical protein VFX60_09100 [Micromonospora sp.]|nr:hypothetical protein [Micromonospora sp.]